MKKIVIVFLCILPALLLVCCDAPKQGEIKVATFNIRVDIKADSLPDSWNLRKEKVTELIRYYDFDIFGTQEALIHQLQAIQQSGVYNYIGVGRDDGAEAGEHSAIFYKKDCFTLLDKGDFWYSETPEEPSYGWEAKYRRICSWGKFEDNRTGKTFFFFSSHYDHEATTARHESSVLLLSKMKSLAGDLPAISVGDFNATPDSDPIQVIYSDGYLKDAYQITETPPYGPVGTFHGYNVKAALKDRIDYIFVTSGIKVKKYGVLTDILNGYFPSDHFPVEAVIEL